MSLCTVPKWSELDSTVQNAIYDTIARRERTWRLDLSQETLTRRVAQLITRAADNGRLNDGLLWYQEAAGFAEFLSNAHIVKQSAAAAVVGICSPQTPWAHNMTDAHNITVSNMLLSDLDVEHAAEVICSASWGESALTTQPARFVERCLRVLRGDDPEIVCGGNKVRSFTSNVFAPLVSNAVTVDTHMFRALLSDATLTAGSGVVRQLSSAAPTRGKYRAGCYPWFTRVFYDIASELPGWLPHQVQAVAWCEWRSVEGRNGATDNADQPPVFLSTADVREALFAPRQAL